MFIIVLLIDLNDINVHTLMKIEMTKTSAWHITRYTPWKLAQNDREDVH